MSRPAPVQAPNMKIGEVADKLGTTTRTLRFYEEEGLVNPQRSEKGTRLYCQADLERFKTVLLLAQLGIPIQQIRQLATARARAATGAESSREVAEQLTDLRRMAEERIAQFRKVIKDIDQAKNLVEQCFNCRLRPILSNCDVCPVGRDLPASQVLRLVWDQDKYSKRDDRSVQRVGRRKKS